MARKEQPCPKADQHTPEPEGYLEWHAWAEEKSKTHRQLKCDGCGRFRIWVPKKRRAASREERR